MIAAIHVALGLALTAIGWLAPRVVARAWRFRPLAASLLDALAPFATFLVLFLAGGRPLFAGIIPLFTYAGFAFADKVKRLVLREPVVFTDMSEVPELFRHPELYLPFAGTGPVIAGAIAAGVIFVLAFFLDRPVFTPPLALTIVSIAAPFATVALIMLVVIGPMARLMRRFAAVGDPAVDSARFGPLAVLGIYGMIARSERAGRRAAAAAPGHVADKNRSHRPPIVMVQSESFFDARRLNPDMPANLLPAFAASCDSGLQFGRLAVPCWGANTTRTEFAALTGLDESAIGYDRFNPYHAFAKKPIASLPWTLRAQGYRTICVHPHDPRFYSRHRIMPLLGFDRFIGEEAFSAAERIGAYVGDRALADFCAALLRDEREAPVFLFVITMENHGPWRRLPEAGSPPAPILSLPGTAETNGLAQYLGSLRNADAMIARLTAALSQDDRSGLLAFYGDHLPSFPDTFARLGFTDNATDYVLWTPDVAATPRRRDIAAHDLPAAILAARDAMART